MATETAGVSTMDVAGTGAHKAAMPQLDFTTYANQIFWLAVTLVVLYFVVTRLIIPRIGGVLTERTATVERDIAAADELKKKAVQAEAAYNQALADARAEAAKIVAAAKAEIQAELDRATAEADRQIMAKSAESERRIGEIRAQAAESVSDVARATAGDIVAAMGGSADGAAVDQAVTTRLKG